MLGDDVNGTKVGLMLGMGVGEVVVGATLGMKLGELVVETVTLRMRLLDESAM
jgi:hypothetical protein